MIIKLSIKKRREDSQRKTRESINTIDTAKDIVQKEEDTVKEYVMSSRRS